MVSAATTIVLNQGIEIVQLVRHESAGGERGYEGRCNRQCKLKLCHPIRQLVTVSNERVVDEHGENGSERYDDQMQEPGALELHHKIFPTRHPFH